MTEEKETPKPSDVAGRLDGLVSFHLEWHPASEDATTEGDYLLYNPCDGFHVAEIVFLDDGQPDGFIFFGGGDVGRDFYKAWAKLPDTNFLYGHFVKANVLVNGGQALVVRNARRWLPVRST